MLVEKPSEELSMRMLAKRLGVSISTLYHHFRDKEEVLDGVCLLVFSELPRLGEAVDWKDAIVEGAVAYRRVLVRYRSMLPVLSSREPLVYGVRHYETVLELMRENGFESADNLALLRHAESLALGSVMISRRPEISDDDLPKEAKQVRLAMSLDAESAELEFVAAVTAIVEDFVQRKSQA